MSSPLSPLSLFGVLLLKSIDAERVSTCLLALGNKVGA